MTQIYSQHWTVIRLSLSRYWQGPAELRIAYREVANEALSQMHPYEACILGYLGKSDRSLSQILCRRFIKRSEIRALYNRSKERFIKLVNEIQRQRGWPPAPPESEKLQKMRRTREEIRLDSKVPLTVKTALEVFGICPGESSSAFPGQRYRDLLKHYHPDLFHAKGPEAVRIANQRTARINAAKDFLHAHLYR